MSRETNRIERENVAREDGVDLMAARTGNAPRPRATAGGYIRATHPDTGQPVAFVPGEALPVWAAEALDGGRATYDQASNVWTLDAK